MGGTVNRGNTIQLTLFQVIEDNAPAAATKTPRPGHHCDACNLHTTCLTLYISHVSSE